jgi:Serine dehydrogenase proteinase
VPTWGQILKEVNESARLRAPTGPDLDGIRHKYLLGLKAISGRPVISYSSGWLQKRNSRITYSVEGSDVHGFMECCYGVKERELDLILHSPGGSPQAAEQILEYLRTRFDYIRAIVPLQAKSAATMIALGCDEILVGAHSELGPIDPQILVPVPEGSRFAPAHAILRDFERAKEQCKQDVASIAAWTPILRSYAGGLIEFCNQAIKLSMEVVAAWLEKYMLRHEDMVIPESERAAKAAQIAEWFGSADSYDRFRTHARPIRYPELQSIGLRVKRLEDDDALQDAVLSILHVNEITFNGPAAKIIENHDNRRMVVVEQNIAIQAQPPPRQPTNPPLSRQQRRALERKGRR